MHIKRKTRIIILGTIIIAVLVFSFVLIEFIESRNELMKSLENESVNLTKSLTISFENSIETNNEIEELLTKKLDAVASILININLNNRNSDSELSELLERYDVDYIAIASRDGRIRKLKTSGNAISKVLPADLMRDLDPVFSGEYEWLDLGIEDYKLTDEPMYLYFRISNSKNCIIIGVNSNKILEFRKKIGIGRQIQAIAANPNIEYLLLQDNEGIVSASRDIKEISSIESDEFLRKSYISDKIHTRLLDYNGKKAFEAVKKFALPDSSKVLIRLGLSLNSIRAIQQRSMRRVILIGISIFLLLSVLYAFFVTRRGFLELKKEHARIKSYTDLMLESMADAVIAVNSNFEIMYFNKSASKIFDIPFEDAIDKDYNLLFKEDILSLQQSVETREQTINKEIEYTSASGKKILELDTSFVYDDNGNIDIIIAQLKDLTEKKNIQKQLEIKEKLSAMGALASGVAHEIRNPLNAINIIAQRVQREFKPSDRIEDFQKFMQTIRSEVIRVNNIIKQFLDFAKPPKLNKSEVSINDIIEDCISIVESEAGLKNISFEKNYKDKIILSADKEKMKQVFINLFRNSIDAMESGKITCSISRIDDSTEIKITDTGSGIPQDILPKIFNLYYTTKPNGNGLGLSIVHQIISEHNGSIDIQSRENDGTTVIIRLPVLTQHFVPYN